MKMDELISRQAAIDAVNKNRDPVFHDSVHYEDAVYDISKLPSAQPEHGRWVDKYGDGDWHCTRCGAIVEKHEQDYRNWYFCYHCGAKMD